jgi:hypothetical protein
MAWLPKSKHGTTGPPYRPGDNATIRPAVFRSPQHAQLIANPDEATVEFPWVRAPRRVMSDRSLWKSLSPAFTAALRSYDRASKVRLLNAQRRDAIKAPLYHYTSRDGLSGIIAAQKIWFTDYRHLNDDTEIEFGIAAAKAVLAEVGARGPKVSLFCGMTADLLTTGNLDDRFGFYVASFSRKRDHLHQWKNYAQCGEGCAIGFGPQLFSIEDKSDRKPHDVA